MEKIWLKHYQEGVPHEINSKRFSSLLELLAVNFRAHHDRKAYTNFGHSLTYQEVDEYSSALAAYLQQTLGLKKGDRVAVMLPNLLQYPVMVFAILKAGLVVVNVNPLYTSEELTHQLNDSGSKAILVLENFAHTVTKAMPQLASLEHIILTKMGDLLPFPKRHLVNFVVKYIKKLVPQYQLDNTLDFRSCLKAGKTLTLNPVTITSNDIAFLQYTGGTTGISKGAMLSHGNMVSNVEQAYQWIKPVLKEGKELIVTALPLYHIFSLTANCLTFFRVGANNLLITNPRDVKHFIKTIKHVRFTAITGVNTLFNMLLNNDEFKDVDFSGLSYTLSGGMALQESVAKRWEAVTQRPILEAYGLTETCPAVTMNPSNLKGYNGSIGLPISSTELKVCDDDGKELAQGESGELYIKGPQVMQGYWEKPLETQKVLTEDGWLKTGDIAYIDEQGFAYIVDRKKDMIIVSGFNVYPNEVENVIASMPQVLEVGVIGVEHEPGNEHVKAFIVKKDETLSRGDVIAFCRKHLTGYKVPKLIEFVDELPKTNVGKILRRALKPKKYENAEKA